MYSFTYNYNLTDDDYLEYNKYHNFANTSTLKIFFVLKVILFALLGLMVLLNLLPGISTGINIFVTIFFGLAIAYGYRPLITQLLKWQITATSKKGKLPYGKNVHLQFDADIYTETNENIQIKIKYGSLEKIAHGSTAIYLYIGAMQATILPYSAFESEAQKQELLYFLNSKRPDIKIL